MGTSIELGQESQSTPTIHATNNSKSSPSANSLAEENFLPSVSTARAISQESLPLSPISSVSLPTLGTTHPEAPGDVELHAISRVISASEASETQTPGERLVSNLAPVDRGWGAWSYLLGAFIVETVSWAFPTSWGLFLTAYMADPNFASIKAQNLLPLVGTLSSGLMYCSGLEDYADNILSLLLLQGVLYGIGGSVLYTPCLSYLSEWFVARRGTANGIIFAGTSAGGILLPLALPYLIGPYGPQLAVRYLSLAVLLSLIPSLFLIQPRLRDPRVVRTPAMGRSGWYRNRGLWILMAANTVQALAYFVPIIWLPTFASALNLTDEQGSVALILVNGVSVLSRVALGMLADRFSPWVLALTTLSSVSITTFIIWGYFATSLSTLFLYCVAYGIMAGGWSSLWTGFLRPITRDDPVSSTTVLGFLLLSRGIGNVLSAPISTALLHPQRGTGGSTGFEVGGSMFQSLIIYTGVLFAGAALLIGVGWGLEWLVGERSDEDRRSR
ncbi:MFS general substrate transporter [Dacryopinax primogenitus]|uniref:MFS general substrate transporter n=1 Tax=Dacryopinax primogenitus (strain DJM 731) TaxID=1858805 RepID=M5FPX8_DACPD|nr:MFS general substrate transporter [Dacryopinax primogenitus]EJT97393.1 MFS general substrate transporter [Dacryopinax primogenitus]